MKNMKKEVLLEKPNEPFFMNFMFFMGFMSFLWWCQTDILQSHRPPTMIGPMTPRRRAFAVGLAWAIGCSAIVTASMGQSSPAQPTIIRSQSGLQMLAPVSTEPRLRIVLPDAATPDSSIEVLVPEHVTAVKQGSATAEQLYLFRPGSEQDAPAWRRKGDALEYQRTLPGQVLLTARATLESDGVRFMYEFANSSAVIYSMITAVTDPRLTGIFHDVRLERTYVHHQDGFDLLASEVPERLTMPLEKWLPARVLASFTWAVPPERRELREGGLTHYNKSRGVDLPFIATRSADGTWVVASVARDAGNVWSNPELTCQHVDPQMPLQPGQRAAVEVKLLILRGSLNDALERARRQRGSLK
jgi:hypothetical protein